MKDLQDEIKEGWRKGFVQTIWGQNCTQLRGKVFFRFILHANPFPWSNIGKFIGNFVDITFNRFNRVLLYNIISFWG